MANNKFTAAMDALEKVMDAANLASSAITAARKRGEKLNGNVTEEMQALKLIRETCMQLVEDIQKGPGGGISNGRKSGSIYAALQLRNAARLAKGN